MPSKFIIEWVESKPNDLMGLYEPGDRIVMKIRTIVVLVLIAVLLSPFSALTVYAHSGETHETKNEEKKHDEETKDKSTSVNENETDGQGVGESEASKQSETAESPINLAVIVFAAGVLIAIGGLVLVIKKL